MPVARVLDLYPHHAVAVRVGLPGLPEHRPAVVLLVPGEVAGERLRRRCAPDGPDHVGELVALATPLEGDAVGIDPDGVAAMRSAAAARCPTTTVPTRASTVSRSRISRAGRRAGALRTLGRGVASEAVARITAVIVPPCGVPLGVSSGSEPWAVLAVEEVADGPRDDVHAIHQVDGPVTTTARSAAAE